MTKTHKERVSDRMKDRGQGPEKEKGSESWTLDVEIWGGLSAVTGVPWT